MSPWLGLALLILAMLTGCGQARPELAPDVPKLEAGRYLSDGYVIDGSTVGSCAWLGTEWHSYAYVDEHHALKSPLPGTINCRTGYVDGFEVTCSSTLGAELVARGELYGMTKAVGIADARGDIGGCKRLVVAFFLELDPVQP